MSERDNYENEQVQKSSMGALYSRFVEAESLGYFTLYKEQTITDGDWHIHAFFVYSPEELTEDNRCFPISRQLTEILIAQRAQDEDPECVRDSRYFKARVMMLIEVLHEFSENTINMVGERTVGIILKSIPETYQTINLMIIRRQELAIHARLMESGSEDAQDVYFWNRYSGNNSNEEQYDQERIANDLSNSVSRCAHRSGSFRTFETFNTAGNSLDLDFSPRYELFGFESASEGQAELIEPVVVEEPSDFGDDLNRGTRNREYSCPSQRVYDGIPDLIDFEDHIRSGEIRHLAGDEEEGYHGDNDDDDDDDYQEIEAIKARVAELFETIDAELSNYLGDHSYEEIEVADDRVEEDLEDSEESNRSEESKDSYVRVNSHSNESQDDHDVYIGLGETESIIRYDFDNHAEIEQTEYEHDHVNIQDHYTSSDSDSDSDDIDTDTSQDV